MSALAPTDVSSSQDHFATLHRFDPFIGKLIVCAAFLAGAAAWAGVAGGEVGVWMALAAGVGGYLALNIGANDVANNIGPTVGARVLPLGAALVMAAICEGAGAIISSGEVVGTIRQGIIDPSLIPGTDAYVWAMIAALLAAALWMNLATMLGAPISTTHSIVGGVMGAGAAAAGFGVVHWGEMGSIVASWVISPALGAVLAAFCLYLIKRGITYHNDILGAAQRGVPLLGAAMAWTFTAYLMLKGLSKITDVSFAEAVLVGFIVACGVWWLMRAHVARRAPNLRNCKTSVNRLLAIPLVLAAASLSFAHGSNDVANAIGPLAGIVDALTNGQMTDTTTIPFWVIGLGAAGLVIGLLLFGPKVIRTVGNEITHLDAMRAYCIAMSATVTVIMASQLGLPVSTTHVTVGAVLGVGFLRERLKARYRCILAEIQANHPSGDPEAVDTFVKRFHATPFGARAALLADLKASNKSGEGSDIDRAGRKVIKSAYKQDLVNRALVLRIVAAWIITVPATGVLAALVYFTLRGIMLP